MYLKYVAIIKGVQHETFSFIHSYCTDLCPSSVLEVYMVENNHRKGRHTHSFIKDTCAAFLER